MHREEFTVCLCVNTWFSLTLSAAVTVLTSSIYSYLYIYWDQGESLDWSEDLHTHADLFMKASTGFSERKTGLTVVEMENRLDVQGDSSGCVRRLTRYQDHVMNSHLVQVMQVRDYNNADKRRDDEKVYIRHTVNFVHQVVY